jgi:hypothetical protein
MNVVFQQLTADDVMQGRRSGDDGSIDLSDQFMVMIDGRHLQLILGNASRRRIRIDHGNQGHARMLL